MARQICVGCRASPKDMGRGYTTLASASPSTGWHLSAVVAPDGSRSVEWRCGDCWQKYRAAKRRAPKSGQAGR